MENLYDNLNDPLYYPLIVQHCSQDDSLVFRYKLCSRYISL